MKNRTSLTNDEKYILTEREIERLKQRLKERQEWLSGKRNPYYHFSYILGELESIKASIRDAENISDLDEFTFEFYGLINREKQNLKPLKKYLIHLYSKKYLYIYHDKINRYTREKNIQALDQILHEIEIKEKLLKKMPHSKFGVWRNKRIISRLDSPSFLCSLIGENISEGFKKGLEETNV